MTKNSLVINVISDMSEVLTELQKIKLEDTLRKELNNVQIIELTDEILKKQEKITNVKYIENFINAKKVEGCSKRTLKYYKEIVEKLVFKIDKPIQEIQTEEIRNYLSNYKEDSQCSAVTIDNVRRVLSSFFTWLEDEDYIIKSPIRRIHKVRTAKTIKETFTDENLENMRDNCSHIRDLALIELLISTGMRVGEVIKLDIKDINFQDRSCIVFGKGNKQREVYFDAKAKLHLIEYINERDDDNEALFVSRNSPHQRLSIAGIEKIIRDIGKNTDLEKVYPHKFRRTLATMAIDKGMPVEQVQRLLGHAKIETTMHYAMVNQLNVKNSHRKFIS